MPLRILLYTFVLSLFIVSPTQADVLLLEGIAKEPPNTLEGMPRPRTGMTSKRVREIFGKPKKISEPVGKPPITRWEYARFYVIFESGHVINSVMKKPNEIKKPKQQ